MKTKKLLNFCFFDLKRSIAVLTMFLLILDIQVNASNTNSYSQNLIISGTVLGSNGESLPGASIIEKGTSNGVQTDFDGKFTIEVTNKDAVLVISFMGFATQEISLNGQETLDIQLLEAAASLDEIVLIGYGSTRKKDLTGAVSKLDTKDFQKGFVTNAEQLIANKVPGVQITPTSGKPGAGSSFLLRGGASLSATNSPLFVIDGVPIGLSDGPGVLSALNPDDIASFSVLKDASAAAIYGSRGSNGVILISTKRGRSGDLKISFSSKASISENYYKQDVLTGDQYREQAIVASQISGVPVEDFNLGTSNTDWQDEIYQSALTTDHHLSINGGIKNLPYRLSFGHLNQEGTLKTGNFERGTITLNMNPTLFDNHLKINLNIKGMSQKQRIADDSAIYTAVTFDPTQSVRDENSIYGGYWQYYEFASNPAVLHGHNNPVSKLEQINNQDESLRSIGNIQLDYKLHFLPDLSIKLNTGYDFAEGNNSYYVPADNFAASISNGTNNINDLSYKVNNTFAEITLNYSKELEAIQSRIDAVAGYSYYDFKNTNYFYPNYDVDGNLQPNSEPNFDYNIIQSTLISYFGRLIYSLKDKYILSGTIRKDGSSRFSPDNRWGVFPSVSAAWKISDENFLTNSNVVSDLKLRIGYGITGQQDGIGEYEYIPVYELGSSTVKYPIGTEFVQGVFPLPVDRNRKWEQSTTSNIGVDWGLLNNRISGSFDVYYKETIDLLNNVLIPAGTNFASEIVKNIGSMDNKGFEMTINAGLVRSENFNWDFGFNYGYNENKITQLAEGDDSEFGLLTGSHLVNAVGSPRNTFYLYHQVYNAEGKPIEDQMVDVNGDGLINEKDRYKSKSSSPKHNIGFNTNFNYKRFSLLMSFHSNLGQYIFYNPNDNLSVVYDGITRINMSTSYFDTGFNQSGNSNQGFSDYYLQDASFLKMDNISLSYDFGNVFKSKKSHSNLTMSGSVQNVFTITDYTGGDPEAAWNYGVNYGGTYNVPRTYSISLNLSL